MKKAFPNLETFGIIFYVSLDNKIAGVAQLVEQLICNQSVMSSSLFTSSNKLDFQREF